jgi:hypothetical protein
VPFVCSPRPHVAAGELTAAAKGMAVMFLCLGTYLLEDRVFL